MMTPYFKALLHGETRQAKSMKLVLALVGGAAAFVAPVQINTGTHKTEDKDCFNHQALTAFAGA